MRQPNGDGQLPRRADSNAASLTSVLKNKKKKKKKLNVFRRAEKTQTSVAAEAFRLRQR